MRTFDRKSMPMVAWYMLSNESYMNRVIKDVLPTTKQCSGQIVAQRECFIAVGWILYMHTALLSQKDKPVAILFSKAVQHELRICRAVLELLEWVGVGTYSGG